METNERIVYLESELAAIQQIKRTNEKVGGIDYFLREGEEQELLRELNELRG